MREPHREADGNECERKAACQVAPRLLRHAPGDPDRMAEILVNLVKSGDMPQRLSMGADSWDAITAKLGERRAEYEQWKDLSHSTYFA